MHGQFVRALGSVYHLDCFKCVVSALHMVHNQIGTNVF